MKGSRRAAALASGLLLCWLAGLPSWHVCCKESSAAPTYYPRDDSCALDTEGVPLQRKDGREQPVSAELLGTVGSRVPVPPEEQTLSHDDLADGHQAVGPKKPSPSVLETRPVVGPPKDPPAVAVAGESVENISSSSTSVDTPVSKLPETEKPGTIPLAKAGGTEQAETDCDVGEALEASSPSEPPAFASGPESLVGQHIENVSSSHGKGKITKAEFESGVSASEQEGGGSTSPLNTSDNRKHESSDLTKPGEMDSVAVASPKDPEDIPTFDEWKKKVMEVEKEKSHSMHPSPNGGLHASKKVQKNRNNYASVECGAKILAANPEAKSTSAILIENMDLYMLNPCSTKIWFVIELCEPIQVKQLDIANYELFSSTPKDFLVSISDRYPTNKWIKLGTFHGRDERNVQSFPLDEQMYAKYVKMFIKYIKVELVSHFGSEHFCPLSLIRVFGTSMVEEYEEIADSQYHSERQELFDEDYDYPLDYNTGEDKSSKNLLGSATRTKSLSGNATASAAPEMPGPAPASSPAPAPESVPTDAPGRGVEPTSGSPQESPIVQLVQEDEEDTSPSTVTLLGSGEQEDESSPWFEAETQILCRELTTLCCISSFSEYVYRRCSVKVGLYRQHSSAAPSRDRSAASAQLPGLLPAESEGGSGLPPPSGPSDGKRGEEEAESPGSGDSRTGPGELLNRTGEAPDLEPSHPHTPHTPPQSPPLDGTPEISPPPKVEAPESGKQETGYPPSQGISPESEAGVANTTGKSESPTEKPAEVSETKTAMEAAGSIGKEDISASQVIAHIPQTAVPPAGAPPGPHSDEGQASTDTADLTPPPVVDASLPEAREEEASPDDALLRGLQRTATDFYAELHNSTELGYANGNLAHGSNQKESVFMRLNNRIRALEVNMSLSGRYLEELSQRYRKQMEEMQKAFNKTIMKLQNTSRVAEEQDQRQTEAIQVLQAQLTNMTQLVANLSTTVAELKREASGRQSYLVVSLLLCVALGLMVCVQCCRNTSHFDGDYISKLPKSSQYPSPKRCFSSYDDMSLKRRTSFPLIRSKSLQFTGKEVDPHDLYIVEPLKFSPEKKKKRCKYKTEKIETIKPAEPAHPVANGDLKGRRPFTNQRDFSNMGGVYHSSYKGPPSEGSSETSSQSEESYNGEV